MSAQIAINGFGRIGRAAFKILQEKDEVEIVAINDLTPIDNLAYLLKYDTIYGIYDKDISFDENHLILEGKKIKVFSEKDPKELPWNDLNVDVVLECTGVFTKDNTSKAHLEAGAKGVVVSAPTKGDSNDILAFLKGVNSDNYIGQNAVSNASCTTNCISPVTSLIHSEFKILKSAMTTIHGYTTSQNLVDGPHKDFRRGRAAAQNLVPTTTGAAIATTEVIPELKGLFDGIAIRVPVPCGSISDLTYLVEKKTNVEEVNEVFKKAKEKEFYKGVLEVTEEPLVSTDILKNSHSAIVDLSFTRVIDGDLIKILAWYDNEWGYANRLVDIALMVAK